MINNAFIIKLKENERQNVLQVAGLRLKEACRVPESLLYELNIYTIAELSK